MFLHCNKTKPKSYNVLVPSDFFDAKLYLCFHIVACNPGSDEIKKFIIYKHLLSTALLCKQMYYFLMGQNGKFKV